MSHSCRPARTGVQTIFPRSIFWLGATVTGACLVRQRAILRATPQRALRSMVEGFLIKLAAVLVAVLAFVIFPGVRRAADLRTFFLAFAASILLVLFAGTIDNARVLREGRSS
jgi:hypothetical protein